MQQPQQTTPIIRLQMIAESIEPSSTRCSFKHFFYNKATKEELQQGFKKPAKCSDSEWSAALQDAPEGMVPVLATGFAGTKLKLSEMTYWKIFEKESRLKTQKWRNTSKFSSKSEYT